VAALLVLASSSKNFVALYVFITLVSTVAALVLYAVCAAAALKLHVLKSSMVLIGIAALIYAIAMFAGAGLEATLWGLGLAIAGLPIRAISRWLNGSSRAAAANPAAPPESAS
jgi:APA family basic amino acid/polyamine antiporter